MPRHICRKMWFWMQIWKGKNPDTQSEIRFDYLSWLQSVKKPPKQKTLPEFKYGHPCLLLIHFIQVLPSKFNTKTVALAWKPTDAVPKYFWRNKREKPLRAPAIFWKLHYRATPWERTGRRLVHYKQKRPKVNCIFSVLLCFWLQTKTKGLLLPDIERLFLSGPWLT